MNCNYYKYLRVSVMVFFVLMLIFGCKKPKQEEPEPEQEVDSEWIDNDEHVYEYGICIDSLDVNKYVIRRGDSPSAIFSRLGFDATVNDSLCRVSAQVIDPRKLRDGMEYSTFSTCDSVCEIKYIVFAKSQTDFSIIDLTGDNINTYEYSKEVRLERRFLADTIHSSLWNIIKSKGEDPLLALYISDILAWQIDFFDVKDGDSFRVLYDVAFIDDTTELNIASIEGLAFTHQGKEYSAVPFVQDSVREYFAADGSALKKEFLKAPLDFFRITSKFSNARFHPVLKIYRPHHGVDYAAPTGTPVKTIGNGTVIAKGYDSKGGGNYIKIKHNSVYTTTYMHLSRFAKGINKGSHVTAGSVIGYVGSTGLATGPHLDFRVFKNDRPINPLTLESPPAEPVRAELMDSFRIVCNRVFVEMDSLTIRDSTPTFRKDSVETRRAMSLQNK